MLITLVNWTVECDAGFQILGWLNMKGILKPGIG